MNKTCNLKTKAIIYILLFIAVFFIGANTDGITAYFTDADQKENLTTIGGNEIEITEEFDPPEELKPGITFNKYPCVRNTGTVPCYVRMFAEVNDSSVGQYTTFQFDNDKWTTKKEDGYYYYKNVLKVGETTEPLFTTVSISDSINDSKLKDFDIIIYAESVQSEGFSDYDAAWKSISK